jgi:hypothetical protein
MPSQEKSRPSAESIEPEAKRAPQRIASLLLECGRSLTIYTNRIVVKSPTLRVETSFGLNDRERSAVASYLRPPVTPETPFLQSAFSDENVTAAEYLREIADLTDDAEKEGVVVSDVREDDLRGSDLSRIAQYIDWLEECVAERNAMIERLEAKGEDEDARREH